MVYITGIFFGKLPSPSNLDKNMTRVFPADMRLTCIWIIFNSTIEMFATTAAVWKSKICVSR